MKFNKIRTFLKFEISKNVLLTKKNNELIMQEAERKINALKRDAVLSK